MQAGGLPRFQLTTASRRHPAPLVRRIGKSRHVTEFLEHKRGRDTDGSWRRIVGRPDQSDVIR